MDVDHGPLPEEFLAELKRLEETYLAETDPIRQSGFGGGPQRWLDERGLILDALHGDGDFLDVGCANGYVLECLVGWAAKRQIVLTPYGVDLGAGLIELARKRLSEFADHIWVANAWDRQARRRFRYVYTLYDCVPAGFLDRYVGRLLTRCVKPDGRLIVGADGSRSDGVPASDIARQFAEVGFPVTGSAECGELPVVRIAWIDRQ